MNGQQLDPVSLFIALAGTVFGPTLAQVIGPYAVIILAATTGASWALGRRESDVRLSAAWYFLRINATAVLLTVSAATLAGQWLRLQDHTWLLAPIGLLVGGIGDDWPRMVRWLLLRLGRLLERRAGVAAPDDKEQ